MGIRILIVGIGVMNYANNHGIIKTQKRIVEEEALLSKQKELKELELNS
jgi:hypothetical protein